MLVLSKRNIVIPAPDGSTSVRLRAGLMEIVPEAERIADDYHTVRYKDTSLSCGKDCIVVDGKAEMIAQCDGVDAEDRIEKGRELIASICV